MGILSRIRLRFSLRRMFIAITLIAVVTGYYANSIRTNTYVLQRLRDRGFLLWDMLIDPVGPNPLYNLIYGNPYVWSTVICNNEIIWQFEGWFGVVGYTKCQAEGIEVTPADVKALGEVPFLDSLYFIRCRLSFDAVTRISQLSRMQSIEFQGMEISATDLAALREKLPHCYIAVYP